MGYGRELDVVTLTGAEYDALVDERDDLRAELVERTRERDDLRHERLARSRIDPIERLQNLCDELAESRRESPYDQESWDLADACNQELQSELAAERERRKAAEAALRTIKKSTYICTVSLQDWQYCVLEVQRVADAAMKD